MQTATTIVRSRWDPDSTVAALRTWRIAHGAYPLQWHWRYEGEANPSETTVRRQMGDWQSAIEAGDEAGGLAAVLARRARETGDAS